jgi:Cache domain
MISEKRFSLKSLRTRIVLVVISVGLITTLSILLYQQKVLVRSITEAQEENGLNLVNTVALFVESQHQSILFHKQTSLDKRKDMLRSVLGLALVQIETAYNKMQSGFITEDEAKLEAIAALNKMRYDDGVGYL